MNKQTLFVSLTTAVMLCACQSSQVTISGRFVGKDAKDVLSKTFSVENNDLVLEKDITFFSMCEHHLVPFFGKAHIAYIPKGKVAGLSKLARTVEVYAKKPQLQEKLTTEIAAAPISSYSFAILL